MSIGYRNSTLGRRTSVEDLRVVGDELRPPLQDGVASVTTIRLLPPEKIPFVGKPYNKKGARRAYLKRGRR